jgi:hypothetical protein
MLLILPNVESTTTKPTGHSSFLIILKKFIFNMEGATAATYDADRLTGPKGDDRSESSSCTRMITFDAALLSAVAKETTLTLEDIPTELFIQHILPFVGDYQYRFVASVNRNFHTAYVTAFPDSMR